MSSYYEFHVARRYVQFDGALRETSKYIASLGKRFLVLTACDPIRDYVVKTLTEGATIKPSDNVNQLLAQQSIRYRGWTKELKRIDAAAEGMIYDFYDIMTLPTSEKNIRVVADYVQKQEFDGVIGIGGGKALDFARAITHYVPLRVILIPTLAATNASTSPLSVIYTDDGQRIKEYWRMDNAPDLVIVDTGIIINNPIQAFSAGIGDIMATYMEAQYGLQNMQLCPPALSSEGIGLAIDILYRQAEEALKSLRERHITDEFESVVSMIMHNCGPLWMISTAGLAHAIDEVFLYFKPAHRYMHGVRVGLAVQLMLKLLGATSEEIDKYIVFCKKCGIPTSLKEIELEGIETQQWYEAVQATAVLSGSIGDFAPALLADSFKLIS